MWNGKTAHVQGISQILKEVWIPLKKKKKKNPITLLYKIYDKSSQKT